MRRFRGEIHLASDLRALAALFRNNYHRIRSLCATRPADIARAEELAADILSGTIQKQHSFDLAADSSNILNRAFTVTTRLYEEVRRAVRFAFRDDPNAHRIAPPLFRGKGW